jgi:hypothetical protein
MKNKIMEDMEDMEEKKRIMEDMEDIEESDSSLGLEIKGKNNKEKPKAKRIQSEAQKEAWKKALDKRRENSVNRKIEQDNLKRLKDNQIKEKLLRKLNKLRKNKKKK